MRVPDEMKQCVCFLCVKTRQGNNSFSYRGTGFFVSVQSEADPQHHHIYMITAKHCVEQAKNLGDLYVRLNNRQGGVKQTKITNQWLYPENEADVAVVPFGMPADVLFRHLPADGFFVTDDIIQKMDIGIGDTLYIAGLFPRHYGLQVNIPIIRTGIIAAMPDEPLQDDNTGLEYDAYLAEVQSIGGLSGSPVFVFLEPGRIPNPHGFLRRQVFLLGLIRGHWDYKRSASIDFADNELEAINMGIAIVSPIQEVAALLYGEELVKQRRQLDREAKRY